MSDETIVLDIDKDNAILFDGRQFMEAYGLQSNDEKFFGIMATTPIVILKRRIVTQ